MPFSSQFPVYRGSMEYVCQSCGQRFPGKELYYTCTNCGGVFLLEDLQFERLTDKSGHEWQNIFDKRISNKNPLLQGIFRFYELIAPILEPEDIVSIGEGHTPIIPANSDLTQYIGHEFAYKHEGQNPSASFKDRGMACAFSAIKSILRENNWPEILTVCASTGDTSASAALYAAYVGSPLKSVVLLPQGKVTPQQMGQPLGSGAYVLELPGYFDDCMRVVEFLADNYRIALLNSKNSWRILGQESYSFEIAQRYDWQLSDKAIFVPIGNAGNISAIMSGFLKLHRLGIISTLPKIIGVQSSHADPVYRYYHQEKNKRHYSPIQVRSSVAQAAMIGNPVSFPRVQSLVERYEYYGGPGCFQTIQVEEQEIIEGMLMANRYGHISCTQGGECLAGLIRAIDQNIIDADEYPILDATAHSLKFLKFQEMYFEDNFPSEYEISPQKEHINKPLTLISEQMRQAYPYQEFISQAAQQVVSYLNLKAKG